MLKMISIDCEAHENQDIYRTPFRLRTKHGPSSVPTEKTSIEIPLKTFIMPTNGENKFPTVA